MQSRGCGAVFLWPARRQSWMGLANGYRWPIRRTTKTKASSSFYRCRSSWWAPVRPMLLLLMFSVGLVLLISCVNVTHLYKALSGRESGSVSCARFAQRFGSSRDFGWGAW